MNTPAHAVLNLAMLEHGQRRGLAAWVLAGAIGPDLPNALFLAYHRVVLGMGTQAIYAEVYPLPQWQAVLAPSHSVWLAALVLSLALWRRHAGWTAAGLSFTAHLVFDLLTHGADAHPHLWPLSDLRWVSPVSYWDAAHGARWFVPLELVSVAASAALVWRRGQQRWRRAFLSASCGWLVLAYVMGWAFWGTT